MKRTITLKEFESLLDQVIDLQYRERQCIMERRTSDLPSASQSIEHLGLKLQAMEPRLKEEVGNIEAEAIKVKLATIRRLALQNRTLIEYSLKFLRQLFQQMSGQEAPLQTYDPSGHASGAEFPGRIFETQV